MDVNPPFTDQEKRFVLAEAIKTSSIPVEKILPIFYDETMPPPAWHQMLLPHGRNLQSCMNAFEAIRNAAPFQPHQPAFQTQTYQVPPPASAPKPAKRKQPPESLETGGSASPVKRRISDIPQHPTIRPKPTVGSPGQPSPNSSTQGKKRGRPSKAAVAQRDAEAIARGEVIPPPPRTSSLRPDTPGDYRLHTQTYANIAPMVSPRPIPSPITPATYDTPSFSTSEPNSPGKKKKQLLKKTPKPGESSFSVAQPESGSTSRSERLTYPAILDHLDDTIPKTSYSSDSVGPPPMKQPPQILNPPVSNYGSPAPPPSLPPPSSSVSRPESK